jgi:CrcB protein
VSAYFWIGVGGALGSVLRFWLSGVVADRYGQTFPWNTLVVNVSGSLVIGFLGALSDPGGRLYLSAGARQFLMVGICGGYTTFSSFSWQTLNLLRDREWLFAGGNVVLSVVLCLVAVWLGHVAGSALSSHSR